MKQRKLIAIDLAKSVSQVCMLDENNEIESKKLKRHGQIGIRKINRYSIIINLTLSHRRVNSLFFIETVTKNF